MDEWFSTIPDGVMIEHGGQQIPLREHPYVKESKDLPAFVSKAVNDYREIGNRIPIKISKPEDAASWKKEHLPKLYKAGILEAPPEKPDDYGIVKPEKLAEGLGWNDELSKTFAATLHEHGATKALAGKLLTLYEQALLGTQQTLKTSYDAGMADLHKEHGEKFDERREIVKRMSGGIFKTPEELAFFNETGLGDHPAFLSVLMRLAPLAMQDSSYIQSLGGDVTGAATAESAKAEYAKIMTDKDHPKHKAYWAGDAEVQEYIRQLYQKAYPGAAVGPQEHLTSERR